MRCQTVHCKVSCLVSALAQSHIQIKQIIQAYKKIQICVLGTRSKFKKFGTTYKSSNKHFFNPSFYSRKRKGSRNLRFGAKSSQDKTVLTSLLVSLAPNGRLRKKANLLLSPPKPIQMFERYKFFASQSPLDQISAQNTSPVQSCECAKDDATTLHQMNTSQGDNQES